MITGRYLFTGRLGMITGRFVCLWLQVDLLKDASSGDASDTDDDDDTTDSEESVYSGLEEEADTEESDHNDDEVLYGHPHCTLLKLKRTWIICRH